ncbi:MAG: peroxiredoxin [Actinomycetia bacterium]|nr:peroxiredoxin [Actinomycetes bacterium]
MGISVGDVAPLFTLPAVDGRSGVVSEVSLADHLGSPVVLVFYPADDSPVCTAQLAAYTSEVARFEALDATVLAISPQSVESHSAFAEANGGFGFELLSDEDRSVAASYGGIGLLGLYRRCVYVIDREGKVGWIHRSIGPGLRFRSADDLVSAVESAL